MKKWQKHIKEKKDALPRNACQSRIYDALRLITLRVDSLQKKAVLLVPRATLQQGVTHMAEIEPTAALSNKLNVVIALLLHFALKDGKFNEGKHKTGDLAAFLKKHELGYEDIAAILDSPIASVRELVRLKGHAGKRKVK